MPSLLFRLALWINLTWAWTSVSVPNAGIRQATQLQSGVGIATDYSWREEAFEIEVTVKVPPETKAKDIRFKAKTNSIGLFLKRHNTEEDETEEVMLLNPDRALRGRIEVDGTYWVISDSIEDEAKNSAAVDDDDDDDSSEGETRKQPGRQVTISIEKVIKTAKDDFEVIDYDWNGVYREEAEGEVSYRKYDEPEELNVREYAQSLGVDIDNINMSMVDQSMFSSGLNVTKTGMDSMMNAGLMKEVTQQGDGSEWTTDENGEKVPFRSMLKDDDEDDTSNLQNLYGAAKDDDEEGGVAKDDSIPFLDSDSPWHKAADAAAAAAKESPPPKEAKKKKAWEEKKEKLKKKQQQEALDPISTLTVARLREILRSRGLKVSGNKKELQDRLRAEVQSMVEMDTAE